MEMKLPLKLLEMIPGRREIEVDFFRQCFLQNTTQKAVSETFTHDLKAINLKQTAVFALARKTLKIKFLCLSSSQGNCMRFCRKH